MQAAIRESLVGLVAGAFEAAYPNVPIEYPNKDAVDRNSPPPLWVEFEIKWADGEQVGMAANPKTRFHGFLYVTVWARRGDGTKVSAEVIDWFINQLKYASPTGVCMQAPEPSTPTPPNGWYLEQLKLYFYSAPA